MTDRIQRQVEVIESRAHRVHRRELTQQEMDTILPEIYDRNKSYMERATRRLELFLEHETPILLPDTRIHGLRTIVEFPDIYASGEMEEIQKTHYVHEKGKVTNLS